VNIGLLLEMVAEGAPDRVVVGSRDGGLTAADLLRRSRTAAAWFASTGAEQIGFVDLNSEALPIALFAASIAGLPFAPVNYRLADEQLDAILRRLVPGLVVVGADIAARITAIEGLQIATCDDLLAVAALGDERETDLPWVDPEDVAIVLFTSGTTGEPKAALLRHRHLTSYVIGTVEYLGADEDDAQLVSVPPYHIAGVSAILSSLYSGRRIVYLPGFDADAWVHTVQEERITQAMVVPTMLGRLLTCLEDDVQQLPTLRHLSYGGGRMPPEVIERAMKLLPDVNFVNAYGLTETSSTISVLTPDDHRDAIGSDDPAIRRHLGSVGRPLPTIELEVRGPDGAVLAQGERGEICVRGDQVAGEYLGSSTLTDDGWFPTKDAGWLDELGFLYLEGRLDDVIVRGAENLSPGEIEDALLAHPAVAEAAVVGIPDPEWGQAVAAAVVLEAAMDTSADDLKAWVRERLRSAKTPQVVQFRAELPYNETGKLLRRVLREELSDAK
jgi:fatty-acyl-CoA synthase